MTANATKPRSKARPEGRFVFRRHDNIGVADAEQDQNFLRNCFVDTGDLAILRDCNNPCRILVGRTGSGKTALLAQLASEEFNVIAIKPESLALSYISNSTILNFVLQLGVKLDIFFRLLWRHVFTVEVIKTHFRVNSESDKQNFLERFRNVFRDKKHVQALDYLERWGKSFWEETEYRIKEVTTTLESHLKASLEASIPGSALNAEGLQSLSEEQKQEVIQRAQRVVNQVQIRELSEIIELLSDVLSDTPKQYHILIDRLDENWIEDRLRHLLIRALVETVRDFRKVRQVKTALRSHR